MHSPVLVFFQVSIFTSALMLTWDRYEIGTSDQVCWLYRVTTMYLLQEHHHFTVYNSGEYLDTVNTCAKLSMSSAISEVKALSCYPDNGEVHVRKPVPLIVIECFY